MSISSIALIQLTDKHTEVMGGLISLFQKTFSDFYIYYEGYPSHFCNYYKSVLETKNISIHLRRHKGKPKIGYHDLYVLVTGLEYIEFNLEKWGIPPCRTLLLSHSVDQYSELKGKGAGTFAISPVYKKVPHFLTYCNLPISKKIVNENKINIFLSGFTNPDNKDLSGLRRLFRFLEKNEITNFTFHITNYYPIEELEKFSSICKVYVDATAKKMMKLLSDANYVMTLAKKNSSYHKKQLSGIIPLAVSTGTPLIVDKDLATIYGFSKKNSVIYPFTGMNTIKDVVLSLQEISQKRYSSLRKNLIEMRKKVIKKDSARMKDYVQKILKKCRDE